MRILYHKSPDLSPIGRKRAARLEYLFESHKAAIMSNLIHFNKNHDVQDVLVSVKFLDKIPPNPNEEDERNNISLGLARPVGPMHYRTFEVLMSVNTDAFLTQTSRVWGWLDTFVHELQHVFQIDSRRLGSSGTWLGKEYVPLDDDPFDSYLNAPWEVEARNVGAAVTSAIADQIYIPTLRERWNSVRNGTCTFTDAVIGWWDKSPI